MNVDNSILFWKAKTFIQAKDDITNLGEDWVLLVELLGSQKRISIGQGIKLDVATLFR